MKWFVHIDIDYYPSALVVEADSREQAIDRVRSSEGLGRLNGPRTWALYVTPHDSEAAACGEGDEWRMEEWVSDPRVRVRP